MPVSLDPATLAILGAIGTAVPAVVGWLLARAIKGVDRSIENLSIKVDALSSEDSKIRVEIAKLETRLAAVEVSIEELKSKKQRGRN